MEPFTGCHPRTPRRLDTLNCCLVRRHTTVRAFPPATCSRMEVTLSFTGENSNTAVLSRGLVSIPTPAWRLTPWATPEKERVQPLSRSLVPEPVLCMKVSPTISSWYRSTSRTSSGSFPASEVTFQVPRTSRRCRGSARPGPRFCLPLLPAIQRTQPQ